MSALEEILNKPRKAAPAPQKAMAQPALSPKQEQETVSSTPAPSADPTQPEQRQSMVEWFKSVYEKPLSEEQLEKEAKRQKSRRVISALGDGLSALSNLYFTTKGAPSMYSGRDTLSEKNKARYDKFVEKQKAIKSNWDNALTKAKQFDWQAEREAQLRAQQQANADREYQRKLYADAASAQHRASTLAQNAAHQAAKLEQDAAHHKDNIELGKQRVQATKEVTKQRAEAASLQDQGRRIQNTIDFYDKGMGTLRINQNKWAGSMQQVFDVLWEDMSEKGLLGKDKNRLGLSIDTAQEKEDFVKQHWKKSEKARSLMLELASESAYESEEESEEDLPPSLRNPSSDDESVPPSKRKK